MDNCYLDNLFKKPAPPPPPKNTYSAPLSVTPLPVIENVKLKTQKYLIISPYKHFAPT